MVKVDITPRVKAFVERARQGGQSAGRELATRDSAVWYLEAGVNYSTAQAWKTQGDVQADTVVLPFNFSGNSISEGDLAGAYLALEHAAMDYNAPGRHLHVVDVVETPEQLATGQLMAICVWAEDGQRGAPNTSYPNGYTCSWYSPLQNQSPSFACTSCSANQVIRGRINAANVVPLQPGEYLYDVETWSVSTAGTNLGYRQINWKDPLLASITPNNNGYHETLLYSQKGNPGTISCLIAWEMQYWTGSTWNGMEKIHQAYCPGKWFIQCTALGGTSIGYPTANTPWAVHTATMNYGRVGSAS